MNPEMKVQMKGFLYVGAVVIVGAMILVYYINDMASSALMGASPEFKPHFPTVPVTDITQAPQCVEGYDKQWIGCQKMTAE